MSLLQENFTMERSSLRMQGDTLALEGISYNPAWRDVNNEVANSITHGLGLLLSLPAAAYILQSALRTSDPWHVAGCAIYGLTLIGVYLCSTLSHVVNEAKWKHFFRQCDQGAIYLFIAGTFTPFAMNYVRDGFWLLIPIAVWTIALSGCFGKLFLQHRIHGVELPVFLFLGWLPILAAPHVANIIPVATLWWMLAGGLCYTAGVWFLKNDDRAWWMHSIWHLLVIAGSALHFAAIVLYVHPM